MLIIFLFLDIPFSNSYIFILTSQHKTFEDKKSCGIKYRGAKNTLLQVTVPRWETSDGDACSR